MNLAQQMAEIADKANIEIDTAYKKLADEVFNDLVDKFKLQAQGGEKKYYLRNHAHEHFSYDCYVNGSTKDCEIFSRVLILLRTNGFIVKIADNVVEW